MHSHIHRNVLLNVITYKAIEHIRAIIASILRNTSKAATLKSELLFYG